MSTRASAGTLLTIGVTLIAPGASPVAAQWLIQQWTATTPLPAPMAGGHAEGYGDHVIYIAPGSATLVGDVDLQTGDVLGWRTTLPVPSQASPGDPDAVIIGDYLVLPGYPQSAIARLAPDGSISNWSLGPGTNTHALGSRGVAASGNRIYATGGGASYIAFASVETATLAPDGSLSSWQSLNSLPVPLISGEAQVIGTGLYAYGGHSSTPGGDLSHAREVHRAEILPDGTIGEWQLIGFLLERRSGSASLVFDGTIHVTGGGVHGFLTDTVESAGFGEFGNATGHNWGVPLPTRLSGHSAAVVGRFGFVLGGSNQLYGGNMQSAVYVAELGPRNIAPVADAGPDQEVAVDQHCRAEAQLNGTDSYDPDGDSLTFSWTSSVGAFSGATPLVQLSPGVHDFTLTVSDSVEASQPDEVRISVFDTTAPTFTSVSASPSQLWPPNHKMVPVTIAVTAVDSCGDAVTCSIVSVSSSEPVNGTGDGDAAPDWIIENASTVLLRAERAGAGPGRAYTVTTSCSDASGNSSSRETQVLVPHDRH